jgi:RimJ/RimL family protein N-acetyltransferase
MQAVSRGAFAIALKRADRLIGGVGLDGSTGDESEELALGYWIGQPYWDNGYGREAVAAIIDYGFRTLGLETIRAHTDPNNGASQKVLLYCGLKTPESNSPNPRVTAHGARRSFALRATILYREPAGFTGNTLPALIDPAGDGARVKVNGYYIAQSARVSQVMAIPHLGRSPRY